MPSPVPIAENTADRAPHLLVITADGTKPGPRDATFCSLASGALGVVGRLIKVLGDVAEDALVELNERTKVYTPNVQQDAAQVRAQQRRVALRSASRTRRPGRFPCWHHSVHVVLRPTRTRAERSTIWTVVVAWSSAAEVDKRTELARPARGSTSACTDTDTDAHREPCGAAPPADVNSWRAWGHAGVARTIHDALSIRVYKRSGA